jgi:hypothetical protein
MVMASILAPLARDALSGVGGRFDALDGASYLRAHESEELRGLAPSRMAVLGCPGTVTLFARGGTLPQHSRHCGIPSMIGGAYLRGGIAPFC